MNTFSRPIVSLILMVSAAFLSACDGGGGSGGMLGDSPQGPNNDAGGGAGGDCTYTLNSTITSPTTLVNTGAYCDYELSSWITVRSTLTIEPGVVIRAQADSRFLVEGGQIIAIGTAQNRIVMEGASHVEGYWNGIDIREGRPSTFDYVDIKDAGQVCSVSFCADAAFLVDNTTFSFTNSSLSNSYVHGMVIYDSVYLEAFSNNRFFGNLLSGLAVEGQQVPNLDINSDYVGVGDENGWPYVAIVSGDQERGEVFRWKKLNAPYFIDGYYSVEGGFLYLEAGVELVFGSGAWLSITENGVLQSMGTQQSPNTFRGHNSRPGYWDGVSFSWSPWAENIISYTTFTDSGSDDNLSPAYAAIFLDESQVTLTGNVFADNSRWGIRCSDPEYNDRSVIVDGGGNQFRNNASGDVSSRCAVR